MPDLLPSALAGIATLAALLASSVLSRKMGWDTASTKYIASMEGVLRMRDVEIADLKQTVVDQEFEIRRLEYRLEIVERSVLHHDT